MGNYRKSTNQSINMQSINQFLDQSIKKTAYLKCDTGILTIVRIRPAAENLICLIKQRRFAGPWNNQGTTGVGAWRWGWRGSKPVWVLSRSAHY